ncbi:MAG: DUF1549 domain-containing protein [Bryobacteraceae bacterium]
MFALVVSGFVLSQAQEVEPPDAEKLADHSECTMFGETREKFLNRRRDAETGYGLGELTSQVASRLTFVPGGSRTHNLDTGGGANNLVDQHIFAALEASGVTPAARTTDWEFIRRVTLDLTGRIPVPDRVVGFIQDNSADKRARLVDELLSSPEWVDKWTMYFGDLYQNNVARPSVNLRRYEPGRNAFWKWIKDSLAGGKPYNQMVTELITASTANTWETGEANWLVGGWVINNPAQDNFDQQAANVAETFLGVGHMNCVLCHNGRGHLDELSLWGKTAPRTAGYGLAAFLAKTTTARVNVPNTNNNVYYWRLQDNPRAADYALNTRTGNRPERVPAGNTTNVAPSYPFSGRGPAGGENYRVALAREVTSDFQFARATVNYMWKEFFGLGLVEPANQFDPARLDPDNPPPAPWTLQPSNARLLNALAQRFIDEGYNLKSLMRLLATAEAYQLSSRYGGNWNPAWERLYARKLVRRLWAEEIHDAIAQSSNILPSYQVNGFSSFPANSPFTGYPTYGPVSLAMQFPDVVGMPAAAFLDPFIRGDRDGEERRPEGSLIQALSLMNDAFVTSRATTGGSVNGLLRRSLNLPDDQLVSTLYLHVLSRYPAAAELESAVNNLKRSNRNARAQDLLWSLYNKVDFIFNY